MIIEVKNLEELRKKYTGKKIVAVLGSFDLFHYEHLQFLKDAKALGDILIAVIKDDFIVGLKNSDRPIICQEQRACVVDGIKYVDYVVLATKKEYQKTKDALNVDCEEKCKQWLYSFYTIFEKLKPDILYYEDTKELNFAREYVSQKFGTKLIERKRTAIITTTKIIDKIKKIGN